jgi:hypothetical protein
VWLGVNRPEGSTKIRWEGILRLDGLTDAPTKGHDPLALEFELKTTVGTDIRFGLYSYAMFNRRV